MNCGDSITRSFWKSQSMCKRISQWFSRTEWMKICLYIGSNKFYYSNYREISVKSILSRLYEWTICDLLELEYGEQEDLKQSEFRTGRTCTDNILCLKQLFEKRSAFNQRVHLIFNFQRAYDTVLVKNFWKVRNKPTSTTLWLKTWTAFTKDQ